MYGKFSDSTGIKNCGTLQKVLEKIIAITSLINLLINQHCRQKMSRECLLYRLRTSQSNTTVPVQLYKFKEHASLVVRKPQPTEIKWYRY